MIQSNRLINIAKRCQLLTGSTDDKTYSCPCDDSGSCPLTESQRKTFADHPEVITARKKKEAIHADHHQNPN
jgi:hypothetical protein